MAAPTTGPSTDARAIDDGAFRIVVVLAAILLVLVAVRLVLGGDGPGRATGAGAPAATEAAATAPAELPAPVEAAALLDAAPVPAPPLELEGPAGAVSLAAYRGAPVLVFFGYTHCPDVCPATIGRVGLAIDASRSDARAIFVSVDPERDTPVWLAEYARYMPDGFTAASGSEARVRATANAWGVRYARVETDTPGVYEMSHTADVFVVDRDGRLRGRLPFGTEATTMTAVLDAIDSGPLAATVPSAAPATPLSGATPAPSTPPAADLGPHLVSSAVWAGGSSPLIFTVDDGGVPVAADVQLLDASGDAVGEPVAARAVQPEGIERISYVAVLDIPSAGPWQIRVTSPEGVGTFGVTVLDPGGTAPLGEPAPTVATRTTSDVDNLAWLTTDPLPDPRLYGTSTADALANRTAFVFVVDSWSFKITEQCGQAVFMAKGLVDRWPSIPFIHHEPYRYTLVTLQPTLIGTGDPLLTDEALAWGVGDAGWGIQSMPWIFIVDRDGILRAKYQGIMGSADVDVMLTMLADEQKTAVRPGQNGPLAPFPRPTTPDTVAR